MIKMEEQDEGEEIKRKMAIEGPKIKKELDRPGKLMVSGIPKNATYTNEELEREFSAFGKVLEGERQLNSCKHLFLLRYFYLKTILKTDFLIALSG